MDIVVGTYEQLLLGFRVTRDDEKKGKYKISQSFTDHSHIGCIKSLAISKKGVLASGSTDETIQLLNLKKRVEMGSLVHHEGAITDLSFFRSSHLFSVSDDACLCIWRYRTWECLRTLRGHKDAINSVSIHPSGKLALTVAKDNTLRTWNLVTGRPAYITNTPHVGECVRWSPKGDYYAILYPLSIHIYTTSTAAVECKIETTIAINSMVFCEDTVLAYSIEGGQIILHDVVSDSQLHVIDNDTKRVKSLVSEKCPDDAAVTWLVAGSSDGSIKIWRLNFPDMASLRVVAEVDTGFRIISMAAVCQTLAVKPPAPVKESSSEGEGVEESESDWSGEDEVIKIDKRQARLPDIDNTEKEPPRLERLEESSTNEKSDEGLTNPEEKTLLKRKSVVTDCKDVAKSSKKSSKKKYKATTNFVVTKATDKKSIKT